MIIRAAGKCNLQSTSRYKYPPSCLMISRLGCLCHKVLLLNFNNITTFKWSTSLLVFLTYSFFCLLPIHIAVWRPSLHLHPTACRRIWPLIGQMLRAVNHCGKACGVILLVSFFFFFFPLLLRADLVLYTCLTAAKRILCAFAENASPVQNGAPMDHGALRTACVRRVGRGGAENR